MSLFIPGVIFGSGVALFGGIVIIAIALFVLDKINTKKIGEEATEEEKKYQKNRIIIYITEKYNIVVGKFLGYSFVEGGMVILKMKRIGIGNWNKFDSEPMPVSQVAIDLCCLFPGFKSGSITIAIKDIPEWLNKIFKSYIHNNPEVMEDYWGNLRADDLQQIKRLTRILKEANLEIDPDRQKKEDEDTERAIQRKRRLELRERPQESKIIYAGTSEKKDEEKDKKK